MKLYCGTYKKYNEGSLFGRWMDLDKFANADEFEAACRRLHSDEREPEFMFQDIETDPGEDWQEGLYSESSIPRDYWRMKAEREAEKKAAKARRMTPDQREQESLFAEFWADTCACGAATESETRYREHLRKNAARLVRLEDGGIVTIDRPRIETNFCFGEDDRGQGGDGYGTMKHALAQCRDAETKEGFTRRNLEEFDKEAEWMRKSQYSARHWYRQGEGAPVARETVRVDEWGPKETRPLFPLTETDRANIRAALEKVRAEFVKRLETWWKRFGASHVRTWTYWTEA